MFDVEQEIREWRQEMAATGLASEILDELEEHLREDLEQQIQRGTNAAEAFLTARRRIGRPRALRDEFALISQPSLAEVLRRHKWKILICSAAGLLVAIVLNALRPVPYQSEAQLYVRQASATAVVSSDEKAKTMEQELQILRSWDLSREVAETIGPKEILNKAGGGEDLNRATALIRMGLSVEVPAKSSVIHITFRHPDPDVLQPILGELIRRFLLLHSEVHRIVADHVDAAGSVVRVSILQLPSPPFFDFAKSYRVLAMIVTTGFLAGLAWVFAARLTEVRLKLAR